MFVWDPRNDRVLVSPWVVEQEVVRAMGRLHRLAATLVLTVLLGVAGGAILWLAVPDLRLRLPLLLVWLVLANRLGAKGWELATHRAIRRWRTTFRSRVRKFGLEKVKPQLEEDGSNVIRVVCTLARYTKVTAEGGLTEEVDRDASWGYWIPGLGYLGWGLDSADEAQKAAIRRIAGQLTARRDDQTQPPVATDIREQEETWFTVQFRPSGPAGD